MTGTSDAADRNSGVIAEFRASHGRVGVIFAGAPMLLLGTAGARTGRPRVNPVTYLPGNGRYLIFAPKARADDNPAWYHNLLTRPDTQIEIGDRRRVCPRYEDGQPGCRPARPSKPNRPDHAHAEPRNLRGETRLLLVSQRGAGVPGAAAVGQRCAATSA